MVGGTGVALDARAAVRGAELFVAVDLDAGAGADARVRIASGVERAWLAEIFPDAVQRDVAIAFDEADWRRAPRAGALPRPRPERADEPGRRPRRRGAGARRGGAARSAAAVALDDEGRHLLDRLRFSPARCPTWGCRRRRAQARRASSTPRRRRDCRTGAAARRNRRRARTRNPRTSLPPRPSRGTRGAGPTATAERPHRRDCLRRRQAARRGGAHPGGLRSRRDAAPGAGRVPLVLELLAPNQRPVQITDDPASARLRRRAQAIAQPYPNTVARRPDHRRADLAGPPSVVTTENTEAHRGGCSPLWSSVRLCG